jgi:NUMOD4 motif-containing protein/HNH endonuclease
MEVWKDIPAYEGLYQVSNWGRLKSLPKSVPMPNGRMRNQEERILKQYPNIHGYLLVSIYKNGIKNHTSAHRLIALTFIPNPNNLPQVNHIDGDKLNNHLENLEWVTSSENLKHAFSIGLRIPSTHRNNCFNELNAKSRIVQQLTVNGESVKEWPSASEVMRSLGFHSSNIGACARGKIKTAYGFKWKYN